MPVTYRCLTIVPVAGIIPPGPTVARAPWNRVVHCINVAAQFPQDMFDYSAGDIIIDNWIWVMSQTMGQSGYSTHNSQYYISPTKAANILGETNNFDFFFVPQAKELTTMTTFRGATEAEGIFVQVGRGDERMIGPHEMLHWFIVYLESKGWPVLTKLPQCAPEPSAHCAPNYGMNEIEPAWFEGMFRATLPGGKGFDDTAWAVPTPTQAGVKVVPAQEEHQTAWGNMFHLKVPTPR